MLLYFQRSSHWTLWCCVTCSIFVGLWFKCNVYYLFNGLFSRTTWVSRYQKGKTSLDLNEARDYGVLGWQWHQLDHMQTICASLQTDNHTNTSSLNFFTDLMLFWMPNQQCQSTGGTLNWMIRPIVMWHNVWSLFALFSVTGSYFFLHLHNTRLLLMKYYCRATVL